MELSQQENELLLIALNCYRNWVETGNPVLSEKDMAERKMKLRYIDPDKRERVRLVDALVEKVRYE
jgi:hypothetical protein